MLHMQLRTDSKIKKAFMLSAAGFFLFMATGDAWADKRKKKNDQVQRSELEAVWDKYNWDNHPPELVKNKRRHYLKFDESENSAVESETPDEQSWMDKNLERLHDRLREHEVIPAN
jgi:hypothetical protein